MRQSTPSQPTATAPMPPPPPHRINGSVGEPLKLTPAQRHQILLRLNMAQGWLILSRSEMNGLRQAMNGATAEIARLNGELARMIAERVAKEATSDPDTELQSIVNEVHGCPSGSILLPGSPSNVEISFELMKRIHAAYRPQKTTVDQNGIKHK